MANPAAQMLKRISKLVCVTLCSPNILNNFSATLDFIRMLYCFCSLIRSLKNSGNSKGMRVMSLSICLENFRVDPLSKIVYYVISSTCIKNNKKSSRACVYDAIIHSGNVERMLARQASKTRFSHILQTFPAYIIITS